MRPRSAKLIATIFFLIAPVAHAAAPSFQGIDLARAHGVSADGKFVVGGAYRWSATEGLLSLTSPWDEFYAVALAVSADGSVVVGSRSFEPYDPHTEAFRWTAQSGIVGLGDLPGGMVYSEAFGISADGSVIVGVSQGELAPETEAFRWTAADGMVSLGLGYARAVSADGSVVVGESNGEAFRWTAETGMIGLGLLPGAYSSGAYDVSADGRVVVGGASFTDPEVGGEAFRWTAEEGMVGLGHLSFPGSWGRKYSYASGVSADGSVVVGTSYDVGPLEIENRAFRWDPLHGMRSLHTLLEQSYGVDLDGWTLLDAIGVSDNGRTIVGNGYSPLDQAWAAVVGPCGDGVDNDRDGLTDHPNDPGCESPASPSENPMCQDGIDNQGDGTIDFDGGSSANHGTQLAPPDPKCVHSYENRETPSCGLGGEIVLGMGSLMAWRRRRVVRTAQA